MLERSQVGATVELSAVPRSPALARLLDGPDRALGLECVLAGGDDYELCFTAQPASAGRIAAIAASTGLPLVRIGTITRGSALVVRDEAGAPLSALPRAYDHFG